MSEQADDQGPAEGRVAVAPLQIVRHVPAPFTLVAQSPAQVISYAAAFVRGSAPVPLYLRQLALLI